MRLLCGIQPIASEVFRKGIGIRVDLEEAHHTVAMEKERTPTIGQRGGCDLRARDRR
jgi:hypothetical protein